MKGSMDTQPTGIIIEEAPRATTKSLTKLNLNNPSSKHSVTTFSSSSSSG
jgi:hypothetical protein